MKYHFDNTLDEKGKPKHIHYLDMEDGEGEKPLTGSSSVMDVLNKPLSWWAAGEAVKTLGWIHPEIKKNGKKIGEVPTEDRLKISEPRHIDIIKMTDIQYLVALDKAYKAHATSLDESAKKGTDLHAELEAYIKWFMSGKSAISPKFNEKLLPFINWTNNNVKKFLWSEAHSFDQETWTGGITDAGAELNDGRLVIIDFKSSKEAYKSQFCQCGGYAIQIENNGLYNADGKKIGGIGASKFNAFVVVPFGAEIVEPVIEEDVEKFKKGFKLGVELYRVLGLGKKHDF